MSILRVLFLLIAICAVRLQHSYAQVEESGVQFPETQDLGDTKLLLNGTGTRLATWFKVHVYAAGLYVAGKSTDATKILESETPKYLAMQFVRSVGAEKLRDAWETGLKNNSEDFNRVKDSLKQLNAAMKDVEEGDRMEVAFYPGDMVVLKMSGGSSVTIKDKYFPRDLLAVWLGATPPNEELKDGLLGRK